VDASFAFFLLICTLFGIAGGLQGRSKGSSFVLWFFISACLPVFGFLAALVWPGHRHEQRRQCDGCGRLLPITDTMCMGCGTDLAFPDVRFRSVAGSVVAVSADGEVLGRVVPAGEEDEEDEASPYERAADNPYETAAAEDDGVAAEDTSTDAPSPTGTGA
jgi:hypothetical protein